jgi:hypothetical protein
LLVVSAKINQKLIKNLEDFDFFVVCIMTELLNCTIQGIKSIILFCLSLTEEAYSNSGLQTGKLGQTPLSVDQPQSEH